MVPTDKLTRRSFLKSASTVSVFAAGAGPVMFGARTKVQITQQRNVIIYRNEHGYSAWPTVLKLQSGEHLLAFNECWRRRPDYTHMDPTFYGMMIRSTNAGETWDPIPTPIGGYSQKGMDAVGIMQMQNGTVLAHGMRYRYFTLEEAARRSDLPFDQVQSNKNLREKGFPWRLWVDPKMTFVYRSMDEGRTWETGIPADISPYREGFPLRSGVELKDGSILIPCAEDMFGQMKAFVIRSVDGGLRFGSAVSMAEDSEVWFTEPALLALPSGKLLALIRAHAKGEGYLYQSESPDGGKSWSKAVRTGMRGYPAHMLILKDGAILSVRGQRREPYGIRATLSFDEGRTWDVENDLGLRTDFKNGNLGYPTSTQLDDGSILTVYYGEDASGVTCIQGSFYQLSY